MDIKNYLKANEVNDLSEIPSSMQFRVIDGLFRTIHLLQTKMDNKKIIVSLIIRHDGIHMDVDKICSISAKRNTACRKLKEGSVPEKLAACMSTIKCLYLSNPSIKDNSIYWFQKKLWDAEVISNMEVPSYRRYAVVTKLLLDKEKHEQITL